jgi:O-antigen/teichoic acid export membrane protein
MSVTRALAWNTGVQLIGKIISTGFGIAIIGLLTRLLGQEGFGGYSTANAFLQVFALVIDLGLNVTLVALLGEHAGDTAYEKRCSSAIFTLRVVMATICFGLVAPVVGLLSPYPWPLKLTILALCGSFFFPVVNQIVIGVEQRHLQMHTAAFAENIGRIVLLATLLIGNQLGWSPLTYMWAVTVAAGANFFMNFLVARRYASFAWNWDPAFWKQALQRSWPVGVSILFGLIYFKADTLILSLTRPQAEVGLYGTAYRVLEVLITVPFMYAGILLPLLSQAWAKKDQASFGRLTARSFDVMMLLVCPLIAGTLVLGPELMALVAGPDFRASGDILKVLVFAIGVIYLNTVISHAVVALDAQRRMLPIYIGVALFTLAGYVWLIPTYGMWAAAWLTLTSETLVGIGSLWVTLRHTPIPFHPRISIAAIAASVIMGILVAQLSAFWAPIPIAVGAVVYFVCVYAFGGIPKDVLKEVLSNKTLVEEPLP